MGESIAGVVSQIRSILAQQLGLEPSEIRPEANILDDLGADSLDVVEMVMSLEQAFDIETITPHVDTPVRGGMPGLLAMPGERWAAAWTGSVNKAWRLRCQRQRNSGSCRPVGGGAAPGDRASGRSASLSLRPRTTSLTPSAMRAFKMSWR